MWVNVRHAVNHYGVKESKLHLEALARTADLDAGGGELQLQQRLRQWYYCKLYRNFLL